MIDEEYLGVTANQLAKIASDLKAENAKLREQIHWLERGDIMHVLTDQEYIDQCERERLMQVSIDALDAENAKLRDICADMLRTMKHTTGPYIQTNHYTLLTEVFRDGKPTNVQVSLTSLEERYEQRLRKVGIEVD